jgi:hypothetical protein
MPNLRAHTDAQLSIPGMVDRRMDPFGVNAPSLKVAVVHNLLLLHSA